MEFLEDKLPKDLVNIIDEYARDRTQYDKVIKQFECCIIFVIQEDFTPQQFCKSGNCMYCFCGECESFPQLKQFLPGCFEKFMDCRNKYMIEHANELCRRFRYNLGQMPWTLED